MTYLVNTTIHILEQLKMKPVDVKPSIYNDFNKDSNKEGVQNLKLAIM